MELYFAPMSCSLATRIALYETEQSAAFHQVVLSTKRTKNGEDYLSINPTGQVPALKTDDGAEDGGQGQSPDDLPLQACIHEVPSHQSTVAQASVRQYKSPPSTGTEG